VRHEEIKESYSWPFGLFASGTTGPDVSNNKGIDSRPYVTYWLVILRVVLPEQESEEWRYLASNYTMALQISGEPDSEDDTILPYNSSK
jgi:hypothetical protein